MEMLMQQRVLGMSSQRRACYKCGNVGHYAGQFKKHSKVVNELHSHRLEVCSSSERLCYNCESSRISGPSLKANTTV